MTPAVLDLAPPARRSVAQRVALLPKDHRDAWVTSLDVDLLAEVARREWWYVARPDQLEPDDPLWRIWLVQAGRGFGKTRTGAEWIVESALRDPKDVDGNPTEWLCVGPTLDDCRTTMIEGASGIVNVLKRRGIRYSYVKAPRPRITLLSGQKFHFQGAKDGNVGRGLNLSGAWLDELAKWPNLEDAWTEGINLALRIKVPSGRPPRAVVTTTPKPRKLLKEWQTDPTVRITRGSTFANVANLDPAALADFLKKYSGTRTGRQELDGELLTDVVGALSLLLPPSIFSFYQ